MLKQLTSFDVFDTMLIRIVNSPKDVFLVMQKRLRSSIPSLSDQFIRSFWGVRVWSEYSARKHSQADDITLVQIYREIGRRCRLSADQVELLMELEAVVEHEVLFPIEGAASLVRTAREHGDVAFISDTYFPQEFVRAQLARFDLLERSDRIFVSGELGRSKRSGNLYRYVLSEMDLHPENVRHCGDNIFSDIIVPQRLRIHIHPSILLPHPLKGSLITLRERGTYAFELFRARRMMRCCDRV